MKFISRQVESTRLIPIRSKHLIRVPFTEATKELLADKQFVQCGAGKIVNLSHITMVTSDEIRSIWLNNA